jgi:hypothetical protein
VGGVADVAAVQNASIFRVKARACMYMNTLFTNFDPEAGGNKYLRNVSNAAYISTV